LFVVDRAPASPVGNMWPSAESFGNEGGGMQWSEGEELRVCRLPKTESPENAGSEMQRLEREIRR
jgi:hypothetical protein